MRPEVVDRLQSPLDQRVRGTANARSVLVLDNGMTWKSLSVRPEDAEVWDSRKFSVAEICRLSSGRPPWVQSYWSNTFTNSMPASRWFAQFSLTPIARKIEQAIAVSLLSPSDEIDLSGLLRALIQRRGGRQTFRQLMPEFSRLMRFDNLRVGFGYRVAISQSAKQRSRPDRRFHEVFIRANENSARPVQEVQRGEA